MDRPMMSSHWVLIRGLAREAGHWGNFPTILRDSLGPGARVDMIDLPGAGRFSEMRSPISIPEMAEFVREKFLELRRRMREGGEAPPQETYLVAVSLGGMVAASWLERWPDDFTACVLINTSFKGFSPIFRRLNPMSFKHFYQIVRNSTDAFGREKNVLGLVSNRADLYEATAHEWASLSMMRPFSYENLARQLLAAARFEPSRTRPPIPVLILNSERDRMVHPSCSLEIARSWGAELRRHPTAGHDLAHDDPNWLAAQLTDWREKLQM